MFTYLAIKCCKYTLSHSFLNSQEQYLKKIYGFFHRSTCGTCFFLYSLDVSFSLKVKECHAINLTRTHLHIYILKTQSSSHKT